MVSMENKSHNVLKSPYYYTNAYYAFLAVIKQVNNCLNSATSPKIYLPYCNDYCVLLENGHYC